MRLAPLLTLVGLTGTAWGGAALDDAGKPQRTTDATAAPDTTQTAETPVEYGVDLRLRDVFVPSWMLNLFMNSNPGGNSMTGIGFDLVRRRGDVELQLGFETERIEPKEGVYVNNDPTVDFILSPDHAGENLRWYTIEFTFLNHAPINKYVAIRYGGGAGLGILSGGVKRVDTACAAGTTKDDPVPGCVPMGYTYDGKAGMGMVSPDNGATTEPNPYNLPPVFPVVNAIVGVQIRPVPKAVINIEGGIRIMPFFGVSAGYFF